MDTKEMVEMADDNLERLKGSSIDQIKTAFAGCDVVLGVWQDAAQRDGVAMLPIKGESRMEAMAGQPYSLIGNVVPLAARVELKIAALTCRCEEEALLLWKTVGDGAGPANDKARRRKRRRKSHMKLK